MQRGMIPGLRYAEQTTGQATRSGWLGKVSGGESREDSVDRRESAGHVCYRAKVSADAMAICTETLLK